MNRAKSQMMMIEENQPARPASQCRYEPHLIELEPKRGRKDVQIRGVFRMDPRHDPECKPITPKAAEATKPKTKRGSVERM